jgi:diguanylate cyclase
MATVLSAAFLSAQQGGEALSVIIADIDHFKNINDTRGHQAGDFVIAEVARRVGSCLRGEDRVFRYGGEELVVLTHALDGAALGVLCERIRTAIADEALELGGGRAVRVTVSLGASFMLPNEDTRWEDILQRADAALYQAKEGGRNRVVLHRGAAEAPADPA